jgi:hypothetical protein
MFTIIVVDVIIRRRIVSSMPEEISYDEKMTAANREDEFRTPAS